MISFHYICIFIYQYIVLQFIHPLPKKKVRYVNIPPIKKEKHHVYTDDIPDLIDEGPIFF